MRSISNALLHLRYHLPASIVPKDKKLSKIQTLRLAIGYINNLWQVVQNTGDLDDLVLSTTTMPTDLDSGDDSSPCSESSSVISSTNYSETECCDDISE